MAVSTQLALTGVWQAIATAGETVVTASDDAFWAVTGSTSQPSFAQGHVLEKRKDKAMTLTGTERLWVKGQGTLTITADAPV